VVVRISVFIKNHLTYLQDKWRSLDQERATAIDYHDRGVKTTVTMVAQHEAAVKMKKHWDLVAIAVQLRPEALAQAVGSVPVADGDLREAQLGPTQDERDFTALKKLENELDYLKRSIFHNYLRFAGVLLINPTQLGAKVYFQSD
jgi:hypothetical protein